MDLPELAALAGQVLTPEQIVQGIEAIKTALPKLHTEILQGGYRAGLSTTKELYEKADKTGTLDKALASLEAKEVELAEKETRIVQLSDANPNHARQLAEKDLQMETQAEKYRLALERSGADLEASHATSETLRVNGFKSNLRTALDALDLKPDPAELATYKLADRYKHEGDAWTVYEEVVKDGTKVLSPILVDANQTPAEALAASYAGSLPKTSFLDTRKHGPGGEYKLGTLQSGTMLVSEFMKMTPAAQAKYTKEGGRPVD